VEVKGTARADSSDLRSVRAFADDNRPRRSVLVCNERAPRRVEGVDVLPWRDFLAQLWSGDLVR
jgi:hypothetical protein